MPIGISGPLVNGENMLLLNWIVTVMACYAEGQPPKEPATAQPAATRFCLPMFWIFGKPVVGFVDSATTGMQAEDLVRGATAKCAPPKAKSRPSKEDPKAVPSVQRKQSSLRNPNQRRRLARRLQTTMPVGWVQVAAVPPAKEKNEDNLILSSFRQILP